MAEEMDRENFRSYKQDLMAEDSELLPEENDVPDIQEELGGEFVTPTYTPMIFQPTVLITTGGETRYKVLDMCESLPEVNALLGVEAARALVRLLNLKQQGYRLFLADAKPVVSTKGNSAKEKLKQIHEDTHVKELVLEEGITWEMFFEAYMKLAPEFFSEAIQETGVIHWIWSLADLADFVLDGKYELHGEVVGDEEKNPRVLQENITPDDTGLEVFMIAWKRDDFFDQKSRMGF